MPAPHGRLGYDRRNVDDPEPLQRLLDALRVVDGLTPRAAIDRIFAAVDAFTADAPQHDDMTLVVARITSGA